MLKEEIAEYEDFCNIGVFAFDADRTIFSYNPKRVQDGACTLKAFIMLDFVRQIEEGMITGKEMLEVTKENFATGAGTIKFLSEGMKICANDLVELMIGISDHMAANILIDFLGIKHINETISFFGFKHTRLLKKYLVPKVSYVGETTAYEYALFFKKLDCNEFFNKKCCDYMRSVFLSQKYLDFLVEPLGNYEQFIEMYSKTGKVDGRTFNPPQNSCMNDGGICVTESGNYYIAFLAEIEPGSVVEMDDIRRLMHFVSSKVMEAKLNYENNIC